MNDWLTLCPLSGGFDLGEPWARHDGEALLPSGIEVTRGHSVRFITLADRNR